MGALAQPNQPTQVYYDPETSQYFSYKQNTQPQRPMLYPSDAFGMRGISALFPNQNSERIYLNSPYSSSSADRFTPAYVPATYPEMNMLFPALNAGLAQGLISSTQPDGAMLGAGRFIAPQTTSQSKGK